MPVARRYSGGRDIHAACGMLAATRGDLLLSNSVGRNKRSAVPALRPCYGRCCGLARLFRPCSGQRLRCTCLTCPRFHSTLGQSWLGNAVPGGGFVKTKTKTKHSAIRSCWRRSPCPTGTEGNGCVPQGRPPPRARFASYRESRGGAVVRETKVISYQPELYHGWPTLARCRSGRLLLSYSGGRESHVCPFGRVELMQSDDGGQSWTWPRVLLDTAIDDRDSGVLETAQGTHPRDHVHLAGLRVDPREGRDRIPTPEKNPWPLPPERLEAWRAAHRRLTPEQRKAALGVWMLRSTDGGVTWSVPYRCLVNSPHGPIQLADGRLLYAGKALWEDSLEPVAGRTGVCESTDDGVTWRWLADLPVRPATMCAQYHELHAVETADGQIVAPHPQPQSGQCRRDAAERIVRRRQDLERAAPDRRVGTSLAPAATQERSPADDLRPSPPAVWQSGAREHAITVAPGRSR